ncbi:hypothetical protein GCM10017559_53580 [Streptosporangium longisporum]|uniref:Uncharacterized protein n=1 Tax=Streptosporangium longisporum TaxID=46187 RepID=A0ABP6KQZ3_9ACTN
MLDKNHPDYGTTGPGGLSRPLPGFSGLGKTGGPSLSYNYDRTLRHPCLPQVPVYDREGGVKEV